MKQQKQQFEAEITFFSDDIVRVTRRPSGASKKAKANEAQSFSVVMSPSKAKARSSKTIEIHSDADGRLSFYDRANGKRLLCEGGVPAAFTPEEYSAGGPTFRARQSFHVDTSEDIYGLGQHQKGRMSQRGQRLVLAQINMEIAIPFFVVSNGCAVFWDNASPTIFTDNPQETAFESEFADRAEYYFMRGGSPDGAVRLMRELTGQAPLPPLWSFGYAQSRERYKSWQEVIETAEKHRSLGLPLDCMVQDWQYWGGEFPVKWNALEFGNPAFADPSAALEKLHAMNLRCIISIWPNFGPETAAAAKFREIGALLPIAAVWPGGAKTYDAYSPAARDLYWQLIDEGIRRHGVDGWWMDASEPEMGFLNTQEMWPKPDQHDIPTHAGPFRAVRNAFPLAHAESVAQKQKAADSSRRPFILTRSAFAGQQRSGAQVWSGDVTSTWKSFRAQIPAALNFSACGIPLWNSDIGGFFADKEFPGGIAQDGFRELYVRWAQFAALTPMMRSHGTFSPREIWHFGEPGTKHYDAIAKAIRLRYALLPYIYSTAYAVHSEGDSFMRGLFMEDPADPRLRDIADEFMFGRSLLAAPIVQPGATSREVILPKGKWRRFAADPASAPAAAAKVFENKTTAAAPLDEIPIFAKAGAIIPIFTGLVSYSSERPWDLLEIRVFPGADGAFTLYEDEFDGHGYEKGAASQIRFDWDDAARRLTIHARKGSFPGMLRSRTFRVILPDHAPAEIRYSGRETSVELSAD